MNNNEGPQYSKSRAKQSCKLIFGCIVIYKDEEMFNPSSGCLLFFEARHPQVMAGEPEVDFWLKIF